MGKIGQVVDRDIEREPEEIFFPGTDKPVDRPGFVARPVRGLDPTKDPQEISGWRLVPLTGNESDEPPFFVPPELSTDGAEATQIDFMDKIDKPGEPQKS